ncbi:DHA1 family MFS transporter [Mesorhizobium sp. L2C054A000]|nr:MFS transporter [Mesorhizobium sp. L2C054A000]ESZ44389.1 DHA1 family MFS transporter [Mesorhizobium sp. L2C054A000]
MPLALYALAAGAFGIGVTEFVIMGLLIDVSKDLGVSISAAGQLISGYALGVVIGAPLLTIATGNWPRKTVLLALMAIFTLGNLACAIAPDYWTLMGARIITALAHGTFFGVGSVVATGLVAPNKKASAIALMFTGLTIANILGVPFGTWLGQTFGWRATFWAVTLVGLAAFAVILLLVPRSKEAPEKTNLRADLRSEEHTSDVCSSDLHSQILAVIYVGLLGAAAFATVAPLQMWVLEKAQGAGQSLASSFNIAAFNLGNAAGAWLGGAVIAHGLGLGSLTWIAALLPVAALGVAALALRLDRAPTIGAPVCAQS